MNLKSSDWEFKHILKSGIRMGIKKKKWRAHFFFLTTLNCWLNYLPQYMTSDLEVKRKYATCSRRPAGVFLLLRFIFKLAFRILNMKYWLLLLKLEWSLTLIFKIGQSIIY